jgi:hypothetical protein
VIYTVEQNEISQFKLVCDPLGCSPPPITYIYHQLKQLLIHVGYQNNNILNTDCTFFTYSCPIDTDIRNSLVPSKANGPPPIFSMTSMSMFELSN